MPETLFPDDDAMVRTAVLSPEGDYRYRLTRRWKNGDGPAAVFLMLNPSTADAETDDPTIRRCIGFARSWGYSAIEVVNLFAYRTAKPSRLFYAALTGVDVIGPRNFGYIADAISEAPRGALVAAWGAHRPRVVLPTGPTAADAWLAYLCGYAHPFGGFCCLGTSQAGEPRHPLMLPADTQREPWTYPPSSHPISGGC